MPDLAQRLTTALADRYRIERELGRGGMATVFLAEDLKHHRQVALKALEPEVAAAIGPERFLREIETVARLTHPHILPLHDSGVADGLLFYVMPYVEGESLRQRLEREKQLPLDDALRIAREVADALSYAHAHGLVHRDIKPENVLLESGHAVVADFGIARAVAAAGEQKLTATGVMVGTPAYMSPEQVAGGQEVDGRSDLYSLGCVLYELLAGQPPFTGPTAESLAHQHLSVTPRPVTELRPAVPAAVAAALQRALAKTPADRYATTGEFAAALGRIAEPATPVPAVAIAPGSPAERRPYRALRPVLVIAAIAIVALGAWLAWSPVSQWLSRRNAPAVPAKKQWVLVAEFEGPRDEPDVARAVQGLTSAALDQSGIVMTVPRDQLKTALENAGKPDTLRVDGPLARELAYRAGIRSVLEGRVSRVGTGYSMVLRLSDSGSDSTLITVDGAAPDGDALIRTVDQLGRRLRKELGENPAAVRATRDLGVIITPSFEAYRKVEQGLECWSGTQDGAGAMRSHREALALDPDCATAYSAISIVYGLRGDSDSALWACDQALARPRRLTEDQRLFIEAQRSFYRADFEGVLRTLDLQLRLFPTGPNATDAHGLRSVVSRFQRRFTDAAEEHRHLLESWPFDPSQMSLSNHFAFELQAGRLDEAEQTLRRLRGWWRQVYAVQYAVARDDWAGAESLAANPPADAATHPRVTAQVAAVRIALHARRGEVRAAQQENLARAHVDRMPYRSSLFIALITGTPIPELDDATARDSTTKGIVTRGWHAALAGDLPGARRELAAYHRRSPDERTRSGAAGEFLEASIAAAENRWDEVVRLIGPVALRGDDMGWLAWGRIGPTLERWLVAEAYEHTGPLDSAAVAFERVLEPPESRSIASSPPYAHQRLVMIYARMGRREDAERHWREFSAAFTNPDPEVRHLLDEARAAIAGLRAMTPHKG